MKRARSQSPSTTPSGPRLFKVSHDYPAAMQFVNDSWEILQHTGNTTVVDDNLDTLIGWAHHLDGPSYPAVQHHDLSIHDRKYQRWFDEDSTFYASSVASSSRFSSYMSLSHQGEDEERSRLQLKKPATYAKQGSRWDEDPSTLGGSEDENKGEETQGRTKMLSTSSVSRSGSTSEPAGLGMSVDDAKTCQKQPANKDNNEPNREHDRSSLAIIDEAYEQNKPANQQQCDASMAANEQQYPQTEENLPSLGAGSTLRQNQPLVAGRTENATNTGVGTSEPLPESERKRTSNRKVTFRPDERDPTHRVKRARLQRSKTLFAEAPSISNPNALHAIPTIPPRPSFLRFLHNKIMGMMEERESTTMKDTVDPLWSRFDVSALVALGVAAEEMVTASLIPLAELHVARCRAIKDESRKFDELTLPVEEAVLKLTEAVKPGYIQPEGSLPTSRTPNRVHCSVPSEPHSESPAEIWCKAHGCTTEDVQRLWYIYEYFLPQPSPQDGEEKGPSTAPFASGASRAEGEEARNVCDSGTFPVLQVQTPGGLTGQLVDDDDDNDANKGMVEEV